MKTPCAFHQGHTISQFCKSSSCLLPLCSECVAIHRKQHGNLVQQMQLIPIESAVKEISASIANQYKYIDAITVETVSKYRESDDQHKRVFQEILQHKETLLMSIHNTYDSIIQELDNNARRRDHWIRDFNQSVLELKEELNSLGYSLSGDKYLRVVIMWNRMKPNQAIEHITKKAEKKWLVPEFMGATHDQFMSYISNNTHLKVLEIEGDSGVNKILHIIRVLRYGQPDPSPKTSTATIESSNSIMSPHSNPMISIKLPEANPPTSQPVKMLSPSNGQMLKNMHYPPLSSATLAHNTHPINTNSNVNGNSNSINGNHQIPVYLGSPNRKTSTKKLEVLSSLEHVKTNIDNK